MIKIQNPRVWEFDVDDTLIMHQIKPGLESVMVCGPLETITVYKNIGNIRLLIKLARLGWYIRVHSGTGADWAEAVIQALRLEKYVNEVVAKPLGRTDDRPLGDGLAYQAYNEE